MLSTVAPACGGPDEPRIFPDANRRDGGPSESPDAFVAPVDAAVRPDSGLPFDIDGAVPEMDAGIDDRTPTAPHREPVEGLLVGVVSHAETAALLEGVTVSVTPMRETAATDASGHYALPLTPGEYVAHFAREGFLSVHRRVRIDGWERVVVNVSLLPAADPVRIDGMMGGTVETGGTRVTVLGASVVDATGRPVADPEIAVTPIDPVDDLDGAPGDFVGESGDGTEDPLVSYGMVDIEITTSTGPGDFADGTTATIEIPVGELPPGNPPLLEGECMPLWWFDPERGIWVEEGEACAVRTPSGGLVLTGNVGRPGTWNCDRPVVPVCYTGIVTDCSGMPMPGVEITLTGGSVTSATTTRTGLDGTYTVTGAARVGAIIEARAVVAGNTYVEQTDFVNGGDGCTAAPGLAFPFRYVAGSVTATHAETRTFDGARDAVVTTSGSAAQFWDITSGPVPYLMACDEGAVDALGPPPGGAGGLVPTLEVGNPLTLRSGAGDVDLFRIRRGSVVQSYGTMFGTSLPAALSFDVEIRGAAGTVPYTELPSALRLPASLVVTSPAADDARVFDASRGIPIAWTVVPGERAEVQVIVFSRADPTVSAFARLTDDGAETLSVAGTPGLRGRVGITVSRSIRRFEPLPTGAAVMLVGQRSVTFDAEIR
ncbi:MAG: hypothetical protein OHK0013_06430 [Sandaracinaceae bacterium]